MGGNGNVDDWLFALRKPGMQRGLSRKQWLCLWNSPLGSLGSLWVRVGVAECMWHSPEYGMHAWESLSGPW